MDWNTLYEKNNPPDLQATSSYIGNPLWDDFRAHLESTYGVRPTVEHSTCQGAAGWNLKYKKSGRALCTLYPAQGFFTCLVSIGKKEAAAAELLLPTCTQALQQLYWNTRLFNGGRWLMIDVTSPAIAQDAKALIALRVSKKK